jgi:hypothetical protein
MDLINLCFYATVCAILSYLAPRLRKSVYRLAVGGLVGLVAASLLPLVKQYLTTLQ